MSLDGFLDISALENELNPSVFTWDSLRGVIVLLLIIGLGVCVAKRLTRFVWYGIVLMILIQICHIFAMSSLGSHVPIMQSIFKYDVLQSLAQMCVGTPVATVLLYIQAFINSTFGLAFEAVLVIWKIIRPGFEFVYDSIRHLGR